MRLPSNQSEKRGQGNSLELNSLFYIATLMRLAQTPSKGNKNCALHKTTWKYAIERKFPSAGTH